MPTLVEDDSGMNEETLRDELDDNIDTQEMADGSDEEGADAVNEEGGEDQASVAEDESGESIIVGGKIDKPAFCLLDGIFQDPENSSTPDIRVTLPICQLPSIIGRTHKNADDNFVGMGKAKAISRQQCRIEYRVSTKYPFSQLQTKKHGESQLILVKGKKEDTDPDPKSKEVTSKKPVPSTGYFVITALGKNRILVNGQRIEQGQTAHLPSGSTIKISTFSLYFFTPKMASKETMEIPDPTGSSSPKPAEVSSGSPQIKKRKLNPKANIGLSSVASSAPVLAGGGGGGGGSSVGSDSKLSAQGKRSRSLQAEIDALTTEDLLSQMSKAIDDNVWDRRHQLIGSTLSYRAVMEAANDPAVQLQAAEAKGELSRGEIMDWIADSDKFSDWVEQMLSKMEQKSYQASITKALIKAEFKRTASTGRYIKWLLPDYILKGGLGLGASSAKEKTPGEGKKKFLPKVKKEPRDDNSDDEGGETNEGSDESVEEDENDEANGSDNEEMQDQGSMSGQVVEQQMDGEEDGSGSSSESENNEETEVGNENEANSDDEDDLSDESLGATQRLTPRETEMLEEEDDSE